MKTRTRKQFTKMSKKEKAQLISSLLMLKKVKPPKHWKQFLGNDISYWDSIVVLHASQPPANLIAHRASGFAPWHRLLILLLEDALHSVGYPQHLGFPYWNWAQGKDIVKISHSQFGEINPENMVKFVNTGAFGKENKKWPLRVMVSQDWEDFNLNNISYIRRNWGGLSVALTEPQMNGAASINNLRESYFTYSSYPYDSLIPSNKQVFANTLEGWSVSDGTTQKPRFHNLGHVNIGGTMANCLSSVNDPIFFLHHANVDREWAIWQNKWQKSKKKKDKGFNVPLSIVGEVEVSKNGLYLIMSTKTADNFAKVLYKLMSQTINDSSNGFPIPVLDDKNITMEQFTKKNSKGVSLMGYIIQKIEGITLSVTGNYQQTKKEQFLYPLVWYNSELKNKVKKSNGNYQYFTIFTEPEYNKKNKTWTLYNTGVWYWMQNIWIIQNLTNNKKFNSKILRILGGKLEKQNTYQIVDIDTGSQVTLDKTSKQSYPLIKEGSDIVIAPKELYMESMQNDKGDVYPSMLQNASNSESKWNGEIYLVKVSKFTNKGKLVFSNYRNLKGEPVHPKKLPGMIALLYNPRYKFNQDNYELDKKQTIFFSSRFGHNKYDVLGHFNAINEISEPVNLLDNNDLIYYTNGVKKQVKVKYA